MKRVERRGRRSESEIRALVAGYENGNQSRATYCAAALVEVDLQSAGPARNGNGAVAVVLRNGRRVEIDWPDLALVPDYSQPFRGLLGWLEEA